MNAQRIPGLLRLAAVVAAPLLVPAAVHLWPDAWGPACLFRRFFGLRCPGCGMTRAIYAMMRGDACGALAQNFMVVVVLPAAAWVWARHVGRALSRLARGGGA